MRANRLINEKSQYLRQHAYNPVDWYPWSEEAFEKAKRENKPIFLSIGYFSCHWCHVMEKESFEDIEVAEILNKFFVSIKVDREERPDIDNFYMKVCYLFNNRGGWPLTVFLTPDKKPFFADTYIPKEDIYGRIGLKTLLLRIIDIWENNREKINEV
ncbi:MAG: thioredoxin domain-containing protein, partial [Thermodesulfovibrionaceae bacterium]